MEDEPEPRKPKKGNVIVTIRDQNFEKPITYSMSVRLKKNLDDKIIPNLHKRDKDCVVIVDGKEGSGKSTFAFQIGKYVDPTLNINRVVFSPEDFREAILKADKFQCIIYDEAFTGYSSRTSLSPVNRVLVSLAMQMRQKNLFIIIVLPTIFLLDRYMAMFRTRGLFHVYENKGRRGYFRFYNDKKKKFLLLAGKKTMSYRHKGLWTNFNGRFYGKFALGPPEVEQEYRLKKEESLASSEKTSMTSAQTKYKQQRDCAIYLLKESTKMTYLNMEKLLHNNNLPISAEQIGRICIAYKEFHQKKEDKPIITFETD